MPRVSQSSTNRPSPSDPLANTGTHPNVLKRNQACHQCRRRKLKWYLHVGLGGTILIVAIIAMPNDPAPLAYAPMPMLQPMLPQAQTFHRDQSARSTMHFEVVESSTASTDGPKSRYEKLENRINELETLLLQKEAADSPRVSVQSSDVLFSDRPLARSGAEASPNAMGSVHSFNPYSSALPPSPSSTVIGSSQLQNDVEFAQRNQSHSPLQDLYLSASTTGSTSARPQTDSSFGLDVIWPNWPPNLPGPELLRHLVEVFFVFHPHANRLFHAQSFMSTLALPPSHPKFPSAPVLHAICAIGSLYTAAVTSPPLPNFSEVAPDEIFLLRHRIKEQRPDSFAEQQAQYGRETAERLNSLGEDLFQVLQANIILTWFYWSHSRWVDVFLASSYSIRLTVPLGLNMCPPFHSIAKSERPASIIPPARTVIEDETRRNVFWLAYATERESGCGNGWALSIDDQDISQLLPVRGDQFEQGTLVTPRERQWAHTRDLLLNHPEEQTDSFILYIKGTIMISQVKTFNSRFRARHFAGDVAVQANPFSDNLQSSEPIDPRGSQAFIELDNVVSSFRASFPSHLRNPIVNNVVDNHLYTACLMPHVATIVLHDPHAEVQRSGCISALKILTAARAILDLIYNVWSTSFDITLLDSFCSFCWFAGGRVLVRFLQAALEAKSMDQVSTLRAELDFVQAAIAKLGQRIPLAFRFAKMLEDLILKRCGPATGVPAQITFPRPSMEPADFQAFFEESCNRFPDASLHESLQDSGSFF